MSVACQRECASALTQRKEVGPLVVKEVEAGVRLLGVLLLHLARHGIAEADDEVELGTGAALVRAKHDGVGRLVVQARLG